MAEDSMFPGLLGWLAGGSRGVSSNTIVQHLTGIQTLRGWSPDVPADPDDFDRCLRLFRDVPLLRFELYRMASLSPKWAALVDNWEAIEVSHLDEVGLGWTKAREAPRTYALMRNVFDGVKARSQS
jgi:hypothetical protein